MMKPGVDDGDIFHYSTFDINEWDTIQTLYHKNSIITKRTLLDWIPRLLNHDFKPIPQSGTPSYYPKRTPDDGHLDWNNDMRFIYNFVRAQTHPYPGAFSNLDSARVYFWKCQPFDTLIQYSKSLNGQVLEVFPNGDFLVKCGDGSILVIRGGENNYIRGGVLYKDPYRSYHAKIIINPII